VETLEELRDDKKNLTEQLGQLSTDFEEAQQKIVDLQQEILNLKNPPLQPSIAPFTTDPNPPPATVLEVAGDLNNQALHKLKYPGLPTTATNANLKMHDAAAHARAEAVVNNPAGKDAANMLPKPTGARTQQPNQQLHHRSTSPVNSVISSLIVDEDDEETLQAQRHLQGLMSGCEARSSQAYGMQQQRLPAVPYLPSSYSKAEARCDDQQHHKITGLLLSADGAPALTLEPKKRKVDLNLSPAQLSQKIPTAAKFQTAMGRLLSDMSAQGHLTGSNSVMVSKLVRFQTKLAQQHETTSTWGPFLKYIEACWLEMWQHGTSPAANDMYISLALYVQYIQPTPANSTQHSQPRAAGTFLASAGQAQQKEKAEEKKAAEKKVCIFFQRDGRCSSGARCRFLHTKP
jgi:hypothetical protein